MESAAGASNPFSFGSRASTLLLGSSCSLFSATLTKACFQACSLANLLCLCPFLVHLEASSLAILPLLFFCFLRGANFNEIFLLYGPLIPSSSVCRSFNSSCPANFDSSFSSSLRLLRLFILPLVFLGFLHFCSFNLFAFSVLFLLDLHCFLACLFSHLGCFLSCFLIFNDGWRMILPKKRWHPKNANSSELVLPQHIPKHKAQWKYHNSRASNAINRNIFLKNQYDLLHKLN